MTLAERVKEALNQKEKLVRYVITAVCLFLLLRMCLNLAYASAAPYQTFKDCFYYKGIALFLAVLVLVRRVSFTNLPVLAAIVVYVAASVNHFAAAAYEAELRNAMASKCVAWGMFLVILVDVIRTGKRACFHKGNKVFVCLAMIAFTGALAMSLRPSLCLFCPFVALYLTPISKKEWIWLTDCLTVAYYGAFVWVMTKSLVTIPYAGENIRNGYYYGFFQSPWSVGVFCAGAFACVTYWFVKFWTAEKREPLKWIPCIMAMAFPVYTTLIAASRSAEMGIVGCALFAFLFATVKAKRSWKKRGIGALVAVAAVATCGILLLWFLSSVDVDPTETSQFARWTRVAKRMFVAGPTETDYFQSPVLTAMDALLSSRLKLLVQALKNVPLIGSGEMSVVIGEIDYGHPHNTYAAWLLMYGWLGGIPMIVWFFSFLVRSARGVLKGEGTHLFPLLWGGFTAFAILMEFLPWMYPAAFLLFFVQYPLLVEQEEGEISGTRQGLHDKFNRALQ